MLEIYTNLPSDLRSYNSKKKDLKIMAEGIDSTMAVSRNYIIKARIKKDGEIVVKDYYATDCFLIDSVIVSTTPIKIADLPSQTSEILTTLSDFWDVIDKQVKYTNRLSNLVKECELYAY